MSHGGFVPLLAHKHYIEHLLNSSYRFIEENYNRDNYRYRIIAHALPTSIRFIHHTAHTGQF